MVREGVGGGGGGGGGGGVLMLKPLEWCLKDQLVEGMAFI